MVNKPEPIFSGTLSEVLNMFLAEKRGLGYAYKTQSLQMKRFDIFSDDFVLNKNVLSKELVNAWCQTHDGEKARNQQGRICFVKQLGKFMISHGYSAYITPLKSYDTGGDKFIPYIFSNHELATIFNEADKIQYSRNSPTRHLVIPLLLRMLYGCGMRISETLKLTVEDVDLNDGVLYIRHAKFYKERKILMVKSLIERCKVYHSKLHTHSKPKDAFFPCNGSQPYSYSAIRRIFNRLIQEAGIYYGGRGNGPRLHDLRHTFSVHCLKKWTLLGLDLSTMLPILSTYLGHTDMNGTQHYLRLTADLYPHIQLSLQEKFGHVIPDMGGEELGIR